ncbi:hypothetical protein RRG08_022484 [Elysia crispata]|uniref:Uncharacterized protein n=1 Tax=Elysia crispata TaxID=231223 RepID=A0AAE0Z1W2_9GAST|nr:hypothetical protein RRG08_022484 [Elysia crispata]
MLKCKEVDETIVTRPLKPRPCSGVQRLRASCVVLYRVVPVGGRLATISQSGELNKRSSRDQCGISHKHKLILLGLEWLLGGFIYALTPSQRNDTLQHEKN